MTVTANVAVTGATGFVGRAIVLRLLQAGFRVKALVRKPDSALRDSGAELVEGAIEDETAMDRLVQDTDAVVHCAGLVRARRATDFERVNADGTKRLIAAATRAKSKPRVLLMSSMAAREPTLSAYAHSKRLAETALSELGSDLEWLVVRPPAVYGPRDRGTLPLFQQLAKGLIILPAVQGARFSLIFVEDLAKAVVHLLEQANWRGEHLELDDERPGAYDWQDITRIAGQTLGRRVRQISLPFAALWPLAAASECYCRIFGCAPMLTRGKLHELFHSNWVSGAENSNLLRGWRPETDFDQGFPRTLAWYKDNAWL